MRKPQLHKRLPLDNILGLSNFLVGDSKLDEISQKLEIYPNLTFITAGTKPPNPINLLSSTKMNEFFDLLEKDKNIDYILIDSPPTLVFQFSLLSKYCDGTIFMMSISKVDRNLTKEASKLINSRGSEIVGNYKSNR